MQDPARASILVVAGTHGNERNGPWLLQLWQANPSALQRHGFAVQLALGNPEAHRHGCRYIERDLNRSFDPALLADPGQCSLEVERARELLRLHGPDGEHPAGLAIDLHSTTAAMGNSLVLYGRRPADLALAAGLQQRLGLPIYLHESDPAQRGFLVERWPCGLVIEVGPVPQGVYDARVCQQSHLALESALEVMALAREGHLRLPQELVVHLHLAHIDLPRHADGTPQALLHPAMAGHDWRALRLGDPVFITADARSIPLTSALPAEVEQEERYWPVFVNEAAYGEKGIAFSLTRQQSWPVEPCWLHQLETLSQTLSRGLQRGLPL